MYLYPWQDFCSHYKNSKILSNHAINICITEHIIETVFVYIKTSKNINRFTVAMSKSKENAICTKKKEREIGIRFIMNLKYL